MVDKVATRIFMLCTIFLRDPTGCLITNWVFCILVLKYTMYLFHVSKVKLLKIMSETIYTYPKISYMRPHYWDPLLLPLPPQTSAQLTTRYHKLPPRVKNLRGGKMPLKLSLFGHDTRYHYCFFMIPEFTTPGFEACGRSNY